MEKYDENFYRELFKFYDQENTGFITVDKFIEISKSSMPETWNNEERLEEIKKALDPNEIGKIDYPQFVDAIKKLTTEDNNDLIDYDTDVFNENTLDIKKSDSSILDSSGFIDFVDRKSTNSPNSFSNDTFEFGSESSKSNKNNTFHSIDQGINEKLDKDEKLFDDLLSMDFIESRELKRNDSGSDKENRETLNDEDPFGFGLDSINNHRKSLINSTMSNSFLDIKGSNRRGSEYFSNKSSLDQDSHLTDSKVYLEYDILNSNNKNYDDLKEDQLLEKYEDKINVLSFQNEGLTNEKNELLNIISKLNSEKSALIEKIREADEANIEQEKKINQLTQEQIRLVEQLNKLNAVLHEENESHHTMKINLEKTLDTYKAENSRYVKIMSDINRKIELSDQKLNEEIEKYNELKANFLKVLKEKEILKEEAIIENSKNIEKIASLTKELNDSRLFLQQQVQKQRSETIFDQSNSNRNKELESELNKMRLENQRLNEQIDELNAQFIKSNIDNGRMLVNFSQQNSPSLAAEMNTMSKDDLMEKLKTEQQISKRLREYVDEIISKILEYNPEILEINPNRQTANKSQQQKGQTTTSNQLNLSFKNLKAKAK